MHGTEVQRVLSRAYRYLYRNTRAPLAVDPRTLRQHPSRHHIINCQQSSPHVMRFGAEEIPRRDFLDHLTAAWNYQSASAVGSSIAIKLSSIPPGQCLSTQDNSLTIRYDLS